MQGVSHKLTPRSLLMNHRQVKIRAAGHNLIQDGRTASINHTSNLVDKGQDQAKAQTMDL